TICRSSRSRWQTRSSARLRSSMSVRVPYQRTRRPASSHRIEARQEPAVLTVVAAQSDLGFDGQPLRDPTRPRLPQLWNIVGVKHEPVAPFDVVAEQNVSQRIAVVVTQSLVGMFGLRTGATD